MDGGRTRSDGASSQAPPHPPAHARPAMQVVGFRVEGVQPSPEAHNFLLNDHRPVGAGSPTPVIIPPTFQPAVQRDPSARLNPGDVAAGKTEGGAPNETIPFVPSVFLPPTNSGPIDLSGGVGAAPPAVVTPTIGSLSNPPAFSQPKAILHHEKAEAAHAGLEPMPMSPSGASDTASVSGTSGVSAMFRTDESTYHPSKTSPVARHSSPVRHHHTPHAPHAHARAHPKTASTLGPGAASINPVVVVGSVGGMSSVADPREKAEKGGHGEKDKPKSQKEMTKAERRELQEKQRAAKAQGQAPSGGGAKAGAVTNAQPGAKLESRPSKVDKPVSREERRGDHSQHVSGGGAPSVAGDHIHGGGLGHGPVRVKKQQTSKVVSLNPTEMFAHLQQFRKVTMETLLSFKDAANMPPEVLQLGLRYSDGTISGASARCMAMLNVFCQVISSYTTPPHARLNRDLTSQLNNIIDFLVKCRPLALSMGNAIKWLKLRIAAVPPEMPEAEAKEQLVSEIKDFIRNRIDQAHVWLAQLAAEKVDEGDVILVYSYSHIVSECLLEALRPSASDGDGLRRPKRFRVVVVDSRPEHEGLLMLKKLQAAGIACTYAHMNALSFVMQSVTKVFLGASAIMSNGTVMGRAGNAAVAMMAHAHHKPVIVCCESYKFHERVQLDAITHNELGDPDALSKVAERPDVKALDGWQSTPRLALLNLKYDAMPAHYVTAIVTEHALIPPTSVPVMIREYTAMNRE